MSDIKILWDTPNGRGDWSFLPFQSNDVPVNVATPVPVGIGDGITNTFQLLTPDAQIAPISQANIYRNDWQGNQQLYPTPRTNNLIESQNFEVTSGWTTQNNSVGTAATTAPDGTNTGEKLQDTATTGFHSIQNSHASTLPANAQYTVSIFAQQAERQYLLTRMISLGATGNYVAATFDLINGVCIVNNAGVGSGAVASMTKLPGTNWWHCTLTGVPDTAANTGLGVLVAAPMTYNNSTSYTGVTGNGIYVWGAQLESGAVATSYIPTTTAPVTVTDYTLASLGRGALAASLAIGAQLSWTGQYIDQQSSGGYLETGDDLETAILFSLFTDGEAASDDPIPDGSTDRRGWWGDDGNDDGLGGTGSRLWLLARRTSPTDQTLQDAYDYIAQAIQWLVDTDVVARFDINVQWTRPNMIGASIVAWPPGGGAPQTYNWAWGAN